MALEGDDPSQKNAGPVKKETQASNERYYPPPLPSSIEIQFPGRIEENYNAAQKEQKTREKWKIVLEGFTVLFVFLSMLVSLYMWNEMRKATEAAKLSADAAAAATTAWIAIDRFVIKGIDKDKIMFDVVFKNIGKTPALDNNAGWEFTFIPGPPNDLTRIPQYAPYQCPETNVSPGILPPDKTWGTDIPAVMTVEQIQLIKNRAAKVFIHGCAKYRDILTGRERITEVGAYYPGSTNPADLAIVIYAPYNRMK